MEYDSFKTTFEITKNIFNLINIDFILGSSYFELFLSENSKYISELTKIIFDGEKGFEFLKNLKWNGIHKEIKEKYIKVGKSEVEKIVSEWDYVKSIMLYLIDLETVLNKEIILEDSGKKINSDLIHEIKSSIYSKIVILSGIKEENIRVSKIITEETKFMSQKIQDLYDLLIKFELTQEKLFEIEKILISSLDENKIQEEVIILVKKKEFKQFFDFLVSLRGKSFYYIIENSNEINSLLSKIQQKILDKEIEN